MFITSTVHSELPPATIRAGPVHIAVASCCLVGMGGNSFVHLLYTTASEAKELVGHRVATNKSEEIVDNDHRAAGCRAVWKLTPGGGACSVSINLIHTSNIHC